jgi:repressor LexA
MKELTKRQEEVLSFIRNCINTRYPPTIREIADHFDISVKGAYDHLAALKKKNRIRMDRRGPRTIEIINAQDKNELSDFVKIPVLGYVAAGIPINAESNQDGTVCIHCSMLKRGGDYYALRVQGDSMIGAGIMDGDIAVIQQTSIAENGEIVVVQVNDNTTLKRFYHENSRVRLQSENPAYQPIFSSLENIRILGRMVHLSRSYGGGGGGGVMATSP